MVQLAFQPLQLIADATHPMARQVHAWFDDYFAKRFSVPTIPLAPEGTPFQKQVWTEVVRIGLGEVATYGQIAQRLSSSPRAVGQAVGANPIPILIPCHRVVAADGRMGGYSGGNGVTTKRWLLRWEGLDLDSED
ncbi:MAG: methylated-DNA--[protein]-cysteine S-methyltransferase [Magnetococcales bacterium]|nr:methylated-DNA--[protein]-cysteine S-methyltransferase [Magnetococcales bacterium]